LLPWHFINRFLLAMLAYNDRILASPQAAKLKRWAAKLLLRFLWQ
jgi:hypothetical protein